jgi:hypothetical protein
MPEISDSTRRELYRLMGLQPAGAASVEDDLLNKTRKALRLAFIELGYSGKFQFSATPGSSASVFFWDEARWLLTQGQRADPPEILRRLEEFVIKNEVVLHRVDAIWGLHPEQEIQLAEGLRLQSLASLRPSNLRDTLLDADLTKAKPRAAIVQTFIHRPLYFRPPEEPAPFTWDDKHFMSDLSLVLVLLNDSSVVSVAEWYQTTDDRVPVLGTGQGGGGTSFGEPRIVEEIAPRAYNEMLASELASGFLGLSSPDRRRITVALRRLNLAGLREMPSDSALELGIAIEALLSEPGDPTDSISYRLQTRAAVLLGRSIAEREETAGQVSRLYGLRSAAAHGSDLDGHSRGETRVRVEKRKYTARQLAETLEAGKQLCGRLARRILKLGQFPSYRRMMLGEAPPNDG